MKEAERGLVIALRALRASDKLVAELRDRMLCEGIDEESIQVVLSELADRRLIDDRAVANRYSARRTEEDGWGKRKVLADLERRGLSSELLAELERSWDEEGERGRALRALTERAGKLKGLGQASRFLLGRGFDDEVVESVLPSLFDDRAEASEHERADQDHR